MNAVELPSHCSTHSLIATLCENRVFSRDWDKLPLIFGDKCHITQGAIAFLCSWGLEMRRLGRRIAVVERNGATQYLSRMDLFRHLGVDYEETFERHAEVGRFIPLHLIDSDRAVKPAVDAIADLILHQFEDARAFLPALEWSVYEIVDNIRIHSETPVPGAVCAQYFPEKHRLDVGVCDMGRGIKASLEESYKLLSHGDAVTKALERGATRNKEVGQGNGLAGSKDIATANQGTLKIWTGNCMYDCKSGAGSFRVFDTDIPGTGLALSLNTTRPVKLSDLFIGDSDWWYMNVECERIEEQGGLRVADECEHTGGREPARRLRYKIINLLPDFVDGPFPLDFEGIESASSSFLDELLGRLALRLGQDEFRRKISIQNMNNQLQDIANVVLHQRLTSELGEIREQPLQEPDHAAQESEANTMSISESIKIESKDLSVEDLFKDFYTVPDFQREYVWECEHIEKLLQDVQDEFFDEEGQLIKGPEYFLGSIVVCRASDGTLSLIDGQQRMTSIYLILCAIRDLLIEAQDKPSTTLEGQIAASSINDVGDEVFRHRLVLQYDDSKGILKKVVEDPGNLDDVTEKTTSVIRIRSAYRDIVDFLRVNNDTSAKKLKLFYATFTKRVKLIRIITPSLTNALKVFETVNDRGVGLNAMDLLKNLLFMKTSPEDYPALKQMWKDLIDRLDHCNEKPLRFLRYYIMAHFNLDAKKPLREDNIYDWFTKNTKIVGLEDKPLDFLKKLIACAKAWAHFIGSKDASGESNPYLKNLTLLSGAARQHFILLLAGRHLSAPAFNKLCQAIENLFFCYVITREQAKTLERNFLLWSRDLRSVKNMEELEAFLQEKMMPDLMKRRATFDFAFAGLNQGRIQRYRMRYILAKLTQYIEQQAWSNPAHDSLDQYIASTVEVEHILPQKPNPEVKAAFDEEERYSEYVEMLGNLTLLEKTINTSVSNDLYAKKLPGYSQSSYLLTKSLVEKPKVGVDTQLNRAVEHLLSFSEWNSKAIERRQTMLARLAVFVWDMPGDRIMPDADVGEALSTNQQSE